MNIDRRAHRGGSLAKRDAIISMISKKGSSGWDIKLSSLAAIAETRYLIVCTRDEKIITSNRNLTFLHIRKHTLNAKSPTPTNFSTLKQIPEKQNSSFSLLQNVTFPMPLDKHYRRRIMVPSMHHINHPRNQHNTHPHCRRPVRTREIHRCNCWEATKHNREP